MRLPMNNQRTSQPPWIMTDETTPHILTRPDVGFRTDSAHLQDLHKELAATIQRLRDFGAKHGSPEWNADWLRYWTIVEGLVGRIKELMQEMESAMEGNDRRVLEKGLAAWQTIRIEDGKLAEALVSLKAQATALKSAVRDDWNSLARKLDDNLEAIHAAVRAMRIKLELLKEHSKEEVAHLVNYILATLPNRPYSAGMDAENYEQEFRKAAHQLEREHHKLMGFMDVIKGMFMYEETTEERGRRNLAIQDDQPASGA